jgi:site-specific DNA-cytosine methylase
MVAQPINIYGGNKRPDRPEGGFYVRTDEQTSKTLDAATGLNPTCSQGGTAVMVAQPIHYRKSRRAQSVNDHETWVEDAVSNTLNCFDVGDVRSTDVVAQPYVGGVDYENNAHTMDEPTGPLLKGSPTGGGRPLPAVATAMQVRRLTPVECERLQGFPDNYTNIPWRKKPESPDGPRYKALGNSMAVPVMRWIGERINKVDSE